MTDPLAQCIQLVSKPAEANALLCVDVSNLAYRSAYAHETLFTTTGKRSGHIYGSIRSLIAVLENELCPGLKWCLVFCYDGPGAREKRQLIVPSYKANRDPNRFNPIPEVEEVLRLIPGLHIKQEGKEGDDSLAWIAQKCRDTKTIVLYTGDKDLWALIGKNVSVFSPNLKRYVLQKDIEEQYGITDCANIPLCKSLFGDSSDDIKGIERLQKRQVRPTINVLAQGRGLVAMGVFLAALAQEKPPEMTEKSYNKIIAERQRLMDNYAIIVPDLQGWHKESVVHVQKLEESVYHIHRSTENQLKEILTRYECFSLLGYIPKLLGEPIIVRDSIKERVENAIRQV
jgi:5''-3'' exonuclease (including N-terminal domain of PolI)